ncbi:MAG: restriction endonuclease [Acidimicrobiia bacterium]|nr:restriction endonuclease [Acidimicrobiia bacterium]
MKRSGRVILPFERIGEIDTDAYQGGYVVRLYPWQYFEPDGSVSLQVDEHGIEIGTNAFVLYRTHGEFELYPPPVDWTVRGLEKDGEAVTRWGNGVTDTGEYVLRISPIGTEQPKHFEGPPQGIFAPEYADPDTNFLCQVVLAWLTVHTYGSPYTTAQARHLELILEAEGLAEFDVYDARGVLRHGLTACPLCLRVIRHEQLHELVRFEEGSGLVNAAVQVEGATRSTDANLFHLVPLVYGALEHAPHSVAWGHATCNTRLGQRRCYSLAELQQMDLKLGIVREDRIETIGWISTDFQMIRSPFGAVWIQLSSDMSEAEMQGAPPPPVLAPDDELEVPVAEAEDGVPVDADEVHIGEIGDAP